MASESQQEWPNLEDGAMSEANSSVQVHLDSRSVRGLSTSRTRRSRSRRPSPSRTQDPEATLQQSQQSQQSQSSGGLSSQPIHDTLPQKDLLIDLITPTESKGRSLIDDLFHGIKRPHDGETTEGEPSPKRDKLGEELEQMMADARNQEEEDQRSAADARKEEEEDQRSAAAVEENMAKPSTMMRKVLPIRQTRKTSAQGVVLDSEQQQGGSPTTRNSSSSSTPKPRTPRGPPLQK